MQKDENLLGTYAEPDFDHLSNIMRNIFENYNNYKIKALEDSKIIRNKFSWETAVNIAFNHINEITENDIKDHKKRIFKIPEESVEYLFHNGAYCNITGPKSFNYNVKFIDLDTDKIIHEQLIKTNHWIKTVREYYTNWKIQINVNNNIYSEHKLNLYNKRVIIILDSTAIGDKISWVPYIEEFRKKHNCIIFAATGFSWLFKNSYPEINFIDYNTTIPDIYAIYTIKIKDDDININKNNWKEIPLQQIASDFLGLEFKEIKPLISIKKSNKIIKEKYICISEYSTFKCKQWNFPNGWQQLVNYLINNNYKVTTISKEKSNLKNVIHNINNHLVQTINILQHASMFIGVSSGLAWLAWSLNIPTVIISGCTKPFVEMQNCIRIFNSNVCNGCFNDPTIKLERNNWNFCPRNNNFICSTSITSEQVITKIKKVLKKED
ncbi:autotransporter strand-loop-strand O-heptosyltransferase [Patescibacteria group bacterium]|nr:autotransporter strand-loop-strand O-heptosyltransferase [Patescibacteria group bacterium]